MSALDDRSTTTAVGARRPRFDADDKVAGRAAYAADDAISGLLHGRPVLSPYAHARILSVDAAAALEVPGVLHVLVGADMPVRSGGGRGAEPLALDEVVFAGQPVALVVARSEAAAEDGAELVAVDYEPLPPVVDLEAAIAADAPLARVGAAEDETDTEMHGSAGASAAPAEPAAVSANVVSTTTYAEGDLDAAFASAAAVVEGRWKTEWVHQAYLEPQVTTAWVEADGTLAIRTSTQAAFWVRDAIARLYGLPVHKVRVEPAVLGGGFGAKLRLMEPLVVGAALHLRRPVRVVFTRSEDFAAANPAPAYLFDVRAGAAADGKITALDARILVDSGAFTDAASGPIAASRFAGPYRIGAWRVQSLGVRTNRFGAGAYRGPSSTPCAFVVEALLDEFAARLGLDPVEIRRRNAAAAGDTTLDGGAWPRIGLEETLAAVEDHPLWLKRDELPPNEGIGLAAGLFPGGRQGGGAVCRLDADGGLTIVSGYVDATGTDSAMQAIAAEVFGIEPELVRVVGGNTSSAPHAGASAGSMVTYILGSAVRAAAEDAREQLLRVASSELEIDAADLELVDGEVRPVDAPRRGTTIASIAAKVTGFAGPAPPIEGHGTALPPELAPSAAVAIARVRVDPETGRVEVLDYVAAQDVGRALNPDLCEGQMRGGAVQSIGYALHEQLVHDEAGQLTTGSFLNYAIPDIEDVPQIETIIVEVPSPHGPFGAKGIGESAIAPGAAAIASAIAAATGVRLRELPMTPPRVWRALRNGS